MSEIFSSYECMEDRVLIRPIKAEQNQKTESGIITDQMKRPTEEAIVVAVGVGRYANETGKLMPTVLVPGDKILIAEGYGLEINTPEEKGLRLLREGDILCRIKKADEN
jgi:chaperonin GroES